MDYEAARGLVLDGKERTDVRYALLQRIDVLRRAIAAGGMGVDQMRGHITEYDRLQSILKRIP